MKRRVEYGLPHDLQTSVCRSGKNGRLRCGRWRPSAQETFVEFASVRLGLLLGWPIDIKLMNSVSHHLQQLLILQGLGRLIDALHRRPSIWRQWTEIGTCPSPFPAPDRTVSPTSADAALPQAAAGPEPQGSLVKILSKNKDFRERSVRSGKCSQWGQSAPSLNAAAACPAPKQATHCSCVSPAVMKRLQGDTHGLNKRDLPSPLVPLLDIIQVNCNQCSVLSSAGLCISVKSACRQQNRTDTQRAQFWMTEGWRRLCRTCFYASWSLTSPACDVAPFHWTDYTADSEPVTQEAFPKRGDAARVPEEETPTSWIRTAIKSPTTPCIWWKSLTSPWETITVCVSEHFSFAEIIHPPHRCGISRWWLDSMIIAQVCLRLATIKGHSKMCSFITQHNATDVTRFEGACNWHADCRNFYQSCCLWIECSFLYHKLSPKAFQRIWQYIQPASQLQTTCNHTFTFTFMHLADAFIQSDLHCIQVTVFYILSARAFPGNHTSPGPPHPASSPPRSSETSHPDSCCNNRFA